MLLNFLFISPCLFLSKVLTFTRQRKRNASTAKWFPKIQTLARESASGQDLREWEREGQLKGYIVLYIRFTPSVANRNFYIIAIGFFSTEIFLPFPFSVVSSSLRFRHPLLLFFPFQSPPKPWSGAAAIPVIISTSCRCLRWNRSKSCSSSSSV